MKNALSFARPVSSGAVLPWLLALALLFMMGSTLGKAAAAESFSGNMASHRHASPVTSWSMPHSLPPLQAGTTITATKRDALLVDDDSDGEADPGDTLRYTVVVTNTGGVDALGLTVTDTLDLYTSLVTDSLRVTPLARDDAYDAIGNTRITITATNGLLANDVDPDDPAPNPEFNDNLTVTGFDATSANGGDVNVDGDGGFTYDPPLNFEGADTFTYTVEDAHGLSAEATVTITVSEVVWYVDNSAPPDGDGRSHSPFDSLGNSVGGANDIIFIAGGGGNYATTLTLQNGQQLVGQDFGPDDFATVTGLPATLGAAFPTPGASPTITSSGDAITLGENNSVRGLTVGDTSGAGLVGANFVAVTVRDVTINGAGAILDLDSGAVDAIFDALTTTASATFGASLTDLSGNLSAGSGSIAGVSGVPFDVNGGTATVTYPGPIVKNTASRLVQVLNRPAGAGIVTLSGNLTCSAPCTGINVANNSGGTVLFSSGSKVLNTGGNPAVTLSNNGGATITFGNGGLDVDTTSGMGFNATGGGIVNVMGSGNTVDSTTGIAVNIANTTIGGGGVIFESISVNGATSGIVLNNTGNSGGLTVTGDGTLANNASGGTIQNTIGDGLSLTNAHNVTIQQMMVANCGDGTAGDDCIDSNGGSNHVFSAIEVSNTTGSGSNLDFGNGWRATNLGGDNRIDNDSLFTNFGVASTHAVQMRNTNTHGNLTIDDSSFTNQPSGNSATYVTVQAFGSSNVNFTIENNSLFEGLRGDAVLSAAESGSSGTMTTVIQDSSFQNAASNGSGAIAMTVNESGATHNITVTGNTFTDLSTTLAAPVGIVTANVAGNGGALAGNISNNTINPNSGTRRGIQIVGQPVAGAGLVGSVNITIDNNEIDNIPGNFAILTDIDDRISSSTFNITNNEIGQLVGSEGNVGEELDGALLMRLRGTPASVADVLLDNNSIRATTNGGGRIVFLDARDDRNSRVVVSNNTIRNDDAGAADPEFFARAQVGNPTICIDLSNNNTIDNSGTNGSGTYELRQVDGTFSYFDVGNNQGSINTVGTVTTLGSNCTAPAVATSSDIDSYKMVVLDEPATATESGSGAGSMIVPPAIREMTLLRQAPVSDHRPILPLPMSISAKSPASSFTQPPAATPGDTLTLLGDPFTLAAGEIITLTFDAEIATGLPPGVTSVQNQAGVSGDNFTTVLSADPDPDPSFPPINGETITPLDLEADVGIVKVADPDPATAGGLLTYTITISNAGPDAASELAVTDTLPDEFNYTADSCGGSLAGGPPGGAWTWTPAGLEANSSLSCVITGTVVAGFSGTMTNTASVAALTPDPALANNTITETTTVTDNVFSIGDVSQAEGDSGVTAFAFTVARSNNATAASVDVASGDVTAVAGEDYTPLPATTVNFTAGGGLTQTVTVEVHGDAVVELDETFLVFLSNPVNGAIGEGEGQGAIENDDSAALSIDDVSRLEGDSGTTVFTFTVTLSAAVDGALSVDFATADGTATAPDDYVANSGTLDFDGTAGETRTIAVSVNGDTVEEVDETFTVDLENLAAAGRDVLLADAQGQGMILDDDGEDAMHIYWFPISANTYESSP